jgi:sulfite dehydrogenase (quinone) subunit SoeC
MNPAFSVLFLTTLIGAGQGLFLALYAAQWAQRLGWIDAGPGRGFVVAGVVVSIALTALGLFASFFHLGRPERAWRAAAKWRTSWLAREVIALPAFLAATALYGADAYYGSDAPLLAGAPAFAACIALFVCTSMIYACVRFLREWASPLTIVNFVLLGSASGFTLAAALASALEPATAGFFVAGAIGLTLAGLVARSASLVRNARLAPKSTLQTAIGIKHPRIVQIAQGFMGGSFNTREFFHGRSARALRSIKWVFLLGAFVLPLALLAAAWFGGSAGLSFAAFAVQYAGLLAERWFFFAQANHPQNLYYQAIA